MDQKFNEFTSLGRLEELHLKELEAHRRRKEESRPERIQKLVNDGRENKLAEVQKKVEEKEFGFFPPGMSSRQTEKDSVVWKKCAAELEKADQLEERQLIARQQLDLKRLVDQWARGDSETLQADIMVARSLPQPMQEEGLTPVDRTPLEFNKQATLTRVDSRPDFPENERFKVEKRPDAFGLHDSSAPSQRPPRTPDEEKLYQEKLAQLRADAIKREEMKKNFNDLTKGRER